VKTAGVVGHESVVWERQTSALLAWTGKKLLDGTANRIEAITRMMSHANGRL
jgi:hypothetical protein